MNLQKFIKFSEKTTKKFIHVSDTQICAFFGEKYFFPNVKVLLGLYFLFPYPINCCRSGLSFMRFEVVFAVNIYI
jgi:hypothetical protein